MIDWEGKAILDALVDLAKLTIPSKLSTSLASPMSAVFYRDVSREH